MRGCTHDVSSTFHSSQRIKSCACFLQFSDSLEEEGRRESDDRVKLGAVVLDGQCLLTDMDVSFYQKGGASSGLTGEVAIPSGGGAKPTNKLGREGCGNQAGKNTLGKTRDKKNAENRRTK